MELSKDFVYVKKNISRNSSHFNITNDIAIPQFKSTVKKILKCYHDTLVRDISSENNKVTISGLINYNIIYFSNNYSLDSITYSSKFSHELSLPNISDNSILNASVTLESSEYELLGDHRILLKHVATLILDHHQRIKIDILSDMQSDNDIQLLKNNITIPNYLGHVNEKLFFKEDIELDHQNPSIYQILHSDNYIKKISHKIVDEKVLVSALFSCNILYLTDNINSPIASFTFEKNLSQIVNIPQLTDTANIDCTIELSDFGLNILENSDGEQNIIDCEAIFDVNVYASSPKTIPNIQDAYAFSSDIQLEKETVSLLDVHQVINENFYLKNTLPLNSNSSNISVHNVSTRILFSEYKILNNELIVEGIIAVSAFIFDDSDQEKFKVLEQEYPFKHALDYKCNPDLELYTYWLSTENIDFNINIENNLEFKLNIFICTKILCSQTVTLTTDMSITPIDPSSRSDKPTLIIYFTKSDDTLWSIAKKYSTTVDSIKNTNGLTCDSLSPNQQIIIT